MKKKIFTLILFTILVFIFRMETFRQGLFLPEKIEFYDFTVKAPKNMQLQYFDIDHSIKYLYILFTNYNKSAIEYFARNTDKKNSSISLSFKNKQTNDYLDLSFNTKFNHQIFTDQHFSDIQTNKNLKILETHYTDTNICIFSKATLYEKEKLYDMYTMFIQYKGKYKQITLTSNKLEYFQNFIHSNCQKER